MSRPGQAVWSWPDKAGQYPSEFRCLPVQEPARAERERVRGPAGRAGARGNEEHQRQDCRKEKREEIRECEEEEQQLV